MQRRVGSRHAGQRHLAHERQPQAREPRSRDAARRPRVLEAYVHPSVFLPRVEKISPLCSRGARRRRRLRKQPLPFFKNYYSGGIGSVRGFRTASLGPRDLDGAFLEEPAS